MAFSPSVGPCLSENPRVAESEVHPLFGVSFGTFPANFREHLSLLKNSRAPFSDPYSGV
jgi:hypothetical protein